MKAILLLRSNLTINRFTYKLYTFIILVSTTVKKQCYVRTNKRVQKLAQKAKNFPCDLLGGD